jgi:type III pantothenate kinase
MGSIEGLTLLFDIGNTHTHTALWNGRRMMRPVDLPTPGWLDGTACRALQRFVGRRLPEAAAVCSVVPQASAGVRRALRDTWGLRPFELTAATVQGVGVDYPHPDSIGPDRLANAIAARRLFGAPVVVVDFGTAVTFDVVDRRGHYIGGIIAPGLSAMTDYLHEKTALLPRIRIAEPRTVIGRSTREAMLIGAVHGYRGLVRELIAKLKKRLRAPRLLVIATGGYGQLIAARLPEITAVRPGLTLEGLRLAWEAQREA